MNLESEAMDSAVDDMFVSVGGKYGRECVGGVWCVVCDSALCLEELVDRRDV